MRARAALLACSVAVGGTAAARSADANCAQPVDYSVEVDGNTVRVTSESFGERGCPDPDGMLRQDVATGAVVRLADACERETPDAGAAHSRPHESAAYVDSCVPKGTYRYGFARPYACVSAACSTDYFTEATVETPLAADCKRPAGDHGSTPVPQAPWGSSRKICSYGNRILGGLFVFVALVVIGVTGLVLLIRRALRKRRAR